METLKKIINETGPDNFGIVFSEFNKRLPEYGYGDLQIKRMISEILDLQYSK